MKHTMEMKPAYEGRDPQQKANGLPESEVIPQTLGRQEGRGEEVLGMMGSINPFMAPPSPGGGKLLGRMVGDGLGHMVAQEDGPVWDPPERDGH